VARPEDPAAPCLLSESPHRGPGPNLQGTIDVEYRDLNIIAADTVAFSHGLERMTGTLKNGQKFDAWVRFTECYRKTNGHWLAIHDHISVPVDLTAAKRCWTSNHDNPVMLG
jgi:hypothetical protein